MAWRALGRIVAFVLAFVLAAPALASCPPPVEAGAGAAPARDRGILWRITRDGHASWLYGTLHVGKPAWKRFGPVLTQALLASDVLALEIDPAEPALLAALADVPAPALTPALRARLTRAHERACLPADALATLHPLLQALTLTLLDARWLGLDPLFGLERTLAARARAERRPVVALETAAQQRTALVPDDPADAVTLLEQSLAQLEDSGGRRVLQRLARAWESGDLGTLEDYERWCECVAGDSERAFMRRVNDDRNPGLADGIEARHKQGQRVFAAVGALHMTGPAALPRLLQQRGFTVERIVFSR